MGGKKAWLFCLLLFSAVWQGRQAATYGLSTGMDDGFDYDRNYMRPMDPGDRPGPFYDMGFFNSSCDMGFGGPACYFEDNGFFSPYSYDPMSPDPFFDSPYSYRAPIGRSRGRARSFLHHGR